MNDIYYVAPRVNKKQWTLYEVLMGIEPQYESAIPNTTRISKHDIYSANNFFSINRFISELKGFNTMTEHFRSMDRWNDLYTHFKLPKASGGWRPIDAPVPEFKAVLTMLRSIIETNIGEYFHHPCAFAYVKQRCTTDLVKVHQSAKSNWFLHLDFSNFFGSTTLEFVLRMCEKIHPLDIVMSVPEWRAEFEKALELGFLRGGLPQGTPLSPFLTNLMMIPLDAELLKYCGHSSPHMIYTRYADDIFISSYYTFNYKFVESRVKEILKNFNAPFTIKETKTRYGSKAGRNYILGVMLNKDNNITVGHEKKKNLKAALVCYVNSVKTGQLWDLSDVAELDGTISYFRSIEQGYIDDLIARYSRKFGVDIKAAIKAQKKGDPILV